MTRRTPASSGFAVIYGIVLTVFAFASLGYFLLRLSDTTFETLRSAHVATVVVFCFLLLTWANVCFCMACTARESHAVNALLAAGVIPQPPSENAPSVPVCASFAYVFAIIDLLIVLVLVAGGIWFFTGYVSTASEHSLCGGRSDSDAEVIVQCLLGAACAGIWPVILFSLSRTCCETRAALERLTGKC